MKQMTEKEMYQARRDMGLRGQGDEPNLVVGYHSKPDWEKKPVSKKAKLKNTKRARKEN